MQNVTVTDQMNRRVSIPSTPKRIISLVPSQTELLYDLGLQDEVIGITKFCIHPASQFKMKTKVGGTKKLDMELIRSLKPDLIIGNKEENDREQMEHLMMDFPVWMSDIETLDEALDMIAAIGLITAKEAKAMEIVSRIKDGFANLTGSAGRRVAYFIWKDPYMVAGPNTFINDILERAGWINAVNESRYPVFTAENIKEAAPDCIFLSSEPYPFKDKHIAEFRNIIPGAKIIIVDGEMFSWYGSRLLHAPAYLQTLCLEMGY
ncbi:MAG TPA: helical backbone metal receptor [Daejeonella sp.]|nr:helical backbone metal receptor [Daejeonella sp.]